MVSIFSKFVQDAKTAPLLTLEQFSCEKVRIPAGDYKDLKFKSERQPYCRLWFNAIDQGDTPYNTFIGLGPTQSGKSLHCHVLPVMYHLFEVKENVIISAPLEATCESKWYKDFKHIFDANDQFAEMLPTQGPGARGGFAPIIQFKHGPFLRFMFGGGSDTARAEFPARVLAITEADGFAQSTKSKETDPITQLIGRTRHYGARKRIYMECTVTDENGRIWEEWLWSRGQIVLKCPHCRALIVPIEKFVRGQRIKDCWRESFSAWLEAKTELEAEKLSRWICPKCGKPWSEEERYQANLMGTIIFKGQSIKNNRIVGPMPETRTFSIRWSAVNNMFATAPYVGGEAWKAANTSREDTPELAQSQQVWAIPIDLRVEAADVLTDSDVERRALKEHKHNVIPDDHIAASFGVDIGKRAGHCIGLSAHTCGPSFISDDAESQLFPYRIHCFENRVIEIHSDEFSVEDAIPSALRDFRDALDKEFPDAIDQCFVDARYFPVPVYEGCRDTAETPFFRPVFGYGADQERGGNYRAPKKGTTNILYIGPEFHIEYRPADDIERVEINSSHWKGQVHNGFLLDPGTPRSISLYNPDKPRGHFTLCRHLTSERMERVYKLDKGVITLWKRVGVRPNHFLDAFMLALAALFFSIDANIRERRREEKEVLAENLTTKGRLTVKRFQLPATTRRH